MRELKKRVCEMPVTCKGRNIPLLLGSPTGKELAITWYMGQYK
jgi:hypothetical protein